MSSDEPIIDGRPISDLKVVDLKKELELRGLDKKGNKKDLYERLRDYLIRQNENKKPAKTEDSTAITSVVNPLVAQYLATQEQALKAARRDAEMVRAKTSDSEEGSPTRRRSSRISSENSVKTKDNVEASPTKDKLEIETELPIPESIDENLIESAKEPDTAVKIDNSAITSEKNEAQSDYPTQEAIPENVTEKVEDDGPTANGSNIESEVVQAETPITIPKGELSKAEEIQEVQPSESTTSEILPGNIPEETSKKGVESSEFQSSDGIEVAAETVDNDRSSTSLSENGERVETPEPITSTSKIDDEEGKQDSVGLHQESPVIEVVQSRSLRVEKAADEELDYDEDKHDDSSSPVPQKIEAITTPVTQVESTAKTEESGIKEPGKRMLINAAKESKDSTTDQSENVTQDGLVRVRASSPARYPVSNFIHIRCLKRPFTLKALKDLLSTCGTIVGDVWLDDIKSQCIAKFETEEQAQAARERFNNVKWPPFNDRSLRIDYTTEDNLRKRLNIKDEEVAVGPSDDLKLTVTVENKDSSVGNGFKKERELETSEFKKHDKDRPARRYSDRVEEEKKVEQQPTKTLETLFLKTKTQPSIYYLPLSDEEAQKRMELKKAEERDRIRAIESRGSPERKRRRESPYRSRRY
uniref:SAP domain-containing protein n=1 Tax=Acrobeloides nanus TaxID=290746 RepID=A0A914EEF9_9BILA